MDYVLLTAVLSLVSAGGGAYLGAYLKKKGENFATHEDINKLVDQMRAVTQATKEIEAKISGDEWSRQRRWEMKREAVFSVMQALGRADEAVHSLCLAVKADHEAAVSAKEMREAWDSCYREINDFDMKRALALIVCGKETNDTLMDLKRDLRLVAAKLEEGQMNVYEELTPSLQQNFGRAFALVRRELGITPQSNESSVAVSLRPQAPNERVSGR